MKETSLTPHLLNNFFQGMAFMLLAGILLAVVLLIVGLLQIDNRLRGRPSNRKELHKARMALMAHRIEKEPKSKGHKP